jgi:ATP-dependent DNA ligase
MIYYPSRPIRVLSIEGIKKRDPKTWRFQVKFNGHHMVVSTHTTEYMHSRHGAPLTSAKGGDFSKECAQIFGLDCILDGELIGPVQGDKKEDYTFVIWDIPVLNGKDLTREPYQTRLAHLDKYKTDFKELGRNRVNAKIWIAETYTFLHLNAVMAQMHEKAHEGLVAKNLEHHLDWSRVSQLECRGQVKYRL